MCFAFLAFASLAADEIGGGTHFLFLAYIANANGPPLSLSDQTQLAPGVLHLHLEKTLALPLIRL